MIGTTVCLMTSWLIVLRSDNDENYSDAIVVTFENGKEVEHHIKRQDVCVRRSSS
jgi:hypothetical protein